METNKTFSSFQIYGHHKGFYNEPDIDRALYNIKPKDYIDIPDDNEFPYDSACELLKGSCHLFALALEKVLGYTPYIIQGNNKKNFHAFCQIYKMGTWFYVDARGLTSSFDEFMNVANEFVSDEYTIRIVDYTDIVEWKKDDKYFDLALLFATRVIEKHLKYYVCT